MYGFGFCEQTSESNNGAKQLLVAVCQSPNNENRIFQKQIARFRKITPRKKYS